MGCYVRTSGDIWDDEVLEEWQNRLWMQWVPQILYPAGIYLAWIYLEGIFCVWNASRFFSLWLRTSFQVENLSLGVQAEDFILCCDHFLCKYMKIYILGKHPTLQSFQPRSLRNYSVFLYKPYEHNIWGSHILECICPYKILIKEILFPSLPRVTYDTCGGAGKWKSYKFRASSQTAPLSFLLGLTMTNPQCGMFTDFSFHSRR